MGKIKEYYHEEICKGLLSDDEEYQIDKKKRELMNEKRYKLKEYTIKKKRDGEKTWKVVGSILAINFNDAKKQWTNYLRDDVSNTNDFVYVDDNCRLDLDFIINEGPGYYRIKGVGTEVILDNKNLDTFKDDVFTWTLRKV